MRLNEAIMNIDEQKIIKWILVSLGLWGVVEAKFIKRILVGILIVFSILFMLWIVIPKIIRLNYDWDQHQNVNRVTADITRYMEQSNVQSINSQVLIRSLEKDNTTLRKFVKDNKNQNDIFLKDIAKVTQKSKDTEEAIQEQIKINERLRSRVEELTGYIDLSEEKQIEMELLNDNLNNELKVKTETIVSLKNELKVNASIQEKQKDHIYELKNQIKVTKNEAQDKQYVIDRNTKDIQLLSNRVAQNTLSGPKPHGKIIRNYPLRLSP